VKRLRPYVPTHPFWSVVLLRLVVPMDVISYVLGLFTEMTWTSYALATALGLTPAAFILTYIGKTPRAYDIIMFGIGGAVVGWIIYSTRRGARKPAIAAFVTRHAGRSRSHATHRRRRRGRSKRLAAMFVSSMLWSGVVFAEPVTVRNTEASSTSASPGCP
jgi:ABC-type iron transport system FetAB permease component